MKNIKVKIPLKCMWDGKAKCWIHYNKKLRLTSYGKTKKESLKMMSEIIIDVLKS